MQNSSRYLAIIFVLNALSQNPGAADSGDHGSYCHDMPTSKEVLKKGLDALEKGSGFSGPFDKLSEPPSLWPNNSSYSYPHFWETPIDPLQLKNSERTVADVYKAGVEERDGRYASANVLFEKILNDPNAQMIYPATIWQIFAGHS